MQFARFTHCRYLPYSTGVAAGSAYLLLVGAINRIGSICGRGRSIHAWVMMWWQSITITVINRSSIVSSGPLVAKIRSKLLKIKTKENKVVRKKKKRKLVADNINKMSGIQGY